MKATHQDIFLHIYTYLFSSIISSLFMANIVFVHVLQVYDCMDEHSKYKCVYSITVYCKNFCFKYFEKCLYIFSHRGQVHKVTCMELMMIS